MGLRLPSSSTHAQASASGAFHQVSPSRTPEADPFPKVLPGRPGLAIASRLTLENYLALMADESPEDYAVSILAIDQPTPTFRIHAFLNALAHEHGRAAGEGQSLFPLSYDGVRDALDRKAKAGWINRRMARHPGASPIYQSLRLEEVPEAPEPPAPPRLAVPAPTRQVLMHGSQLIHQDPEGRWWLNDLLAHDHRGTVSRVRWEWTSVGWVDAMSGKREAAWVPEFRDLLIAAHHLLQGVPGGDPSRIARK